MNAATHRRWGAAVKTCATMLTLAVLALLIQMGITTWQSMPGRPSNATDAVTEATRLLPTQTRHLAQLGRAAVGGASVEEEFRDARAKLTAQARQLMEQITANPELQQHTRPLISAWSEIETSAGQLDDTLDALREMDARERQCLDLIPVFKAELDALVREMIATGSVASQVYLALHQIVLLDEMTARIAAIHTGGESAAHDAGELPQEIATFARVLGGLQRGDAEMALRRLQGRRARAALAQVETQWEPLRPLLEQIAQQAPARLAAQAAARALEHGADALLTASAAQHASPPTPQGPVWLNFLWTGVGAGALALLAGLGLWQALLRRRRHWDEQDAQQRQREQDAFARLLDEMGALAEGDLSIKATFSEDSVGALAEAINFIAQQLGARIQALSAPITSVGTYTEAARRAAIQCSELSQYQLQELDAALLRLRALRGGLDAIAPRITAAASEDRDEATLDTARECAASCTDLMAMLNTLHTVTTRMGAETARGVALLDALAQSAATQREAADSFTLPP